LLVSSVFLIVMTDKTKNRLIVAAVALITLLPMLYGNIVARKGGPLDDCILDTSDPSYVGDALVKSFAPQGLKSGDAVTFLVPFGHEATVDDLAYVKRFTDALKRAFPDYGILSLSVAASYHDTGEELLNKPILTMNLYEACGKIRPLLQHGRINSKTIRASMDFFWGEALTMLKLSCS